MDGTSYFPSRPEMEANLVAFAERGRRGDPLRLPLDGDPPRRGPDGERFEIETTDGVYRSRVLVLAVGVADRTRRPAPRGNTPSTTPMSAPPRRTPIGGC